jgi:hypothetical protein
MPIASARNVPGALGENGTSDDALIEYLEDAPEPLPPQDPIGPPDVQPGEAPIKSDE